MTVLQPLHQNLKKLAQIFNFESMFILTICCKRRQVTVSVPKYNLKNKSGCLNFRRLHRVVFTPSVTTLLRGENDSK